MSDNPSSGDASRLPVVITDMPVDHALLMPRLSRVAQPVPWSIFHRVDQPAARGLFTYQHATVDGPLMDRVQGLKVVSNFGVGVDHIDLAAAAARGIPVGHTPGVLDEAVADMGMALLLASARQLVAGDRFARAPDTERFSSEAFLGREVHHGKLGIVGLGRIGGQVARRARAFDMEIRYFDPVRRSDLEDQLGVIQCDLEDLLEQSEFVILTVPLVPATRGILNEETLRRTRPGAIVINISRGPIVDTEALTRALQEGRVAAAALDVTDPEPLPRDHPLLSMDNVILTPHIGSATRATRERMADLAIRNLEAGLTGATLPKQATV